MNLGQETTDVVKIKIRFLLITTLIVLIIPISSIHGIVIPMTSEEVLDHFDLIVMGTITNVEKFENRTVTFQIEIEEFLKKPDSFTNNQTLFALGCEPTKKRMTGTHCPEFEIGERGLFLLSESSQGYELSFTSQVSDARCTAEQFLENYKGMQSGLYWTQDGQYDVFFTERTIDIHHTIQNSNLEERDYSIRFASSGGGAVFSDIVTGTIPECTGLLTVTTSFIPTKMGMYGFNVQTDGGGSGSFGTAIVDYGASPLEQYKAKIHGQDTWCKDDLFLILKNDNTPNGRYDNFPACVTINTAEKLIQRGWGFVPHESEASEYFDN